MISSTSLVVSYVEESTMRAWETYCTERLCRSMTTYLSYALMTSNGHFKTGGSFCIWLCFYCLWHSGNYRRIVFNIFAQLTLVVPDVIELFGTRSGVSLCSTWCRGTIAFTYVWSLLVALPTSALDLLQVAQEISTERGGTVPFNSRCVSANCTLT